jgi:structural maintenance of chromosome 2
MKSCKYDPEKQSELLQESDALKKRLENIDLNLSKMDSVMSRFDFQYTPPPNFDKSKVKGLVANLISISKNNLDKANALEVCAGSKLYQVVVDDENTASQLIQKGQLRRRVTIIPLNKIHSFKVKAEVRNSHLENIGCTKNRSGGG